jgi:hypothetical protein
VAEISERLRRLALDDNLHWNDNKEVGLCSATMDSNPAWVPMVGPVLSNAAAYSCRVLSRRMCSPAAQE